MTKKETLPLWYGGGRRKPRNAFVGVGHLNRKGFNIPKQQKNDKERNRRNHRRQKD